MAIELFIVPKIKVNKLKDRANDAGKESAKRLCPTAGNYSPQPWRNEKHSTTRCG